jgi:low affinity Fe/Cu permease
MPWAAPAVRMHDGLKATDGMNLSKRFTQIAGTVAQVSGRPVTFLLGATAVAAWAVSGPAFGFSKTWELVVNTGTTVVTFLMVFLIQNTQNREGAALHAKLDELIRTSAARNTFVGIDKLTENELAELHQSCRARVHIRGAGEKAKGVMDRQAKEAADRTAS